MGVYMIDKISNLERALIKLGLYKDASIIKIAVNLIDKTDGTLTLKKIIDVEERGFGMAFSLDENSLSSQIRSALGSKDIDKYIFANKELLLEYIPDNLKAYVNLDLLDSLYKEEDEESRKKKSFFKKIKDSVFIGSAKAAYDAAKKKVINHILDLSTKELATQSEKILNSIIERITFGEYEEDEELIIFGSESAYIIMGIGYNHDEEIWEAEIFDMTADKASLGYQMSSLKNVFTEAVKYCINHSHKIDKIDFSARESTSDALMKKLFYSTVEELKRNSRYSEVYNEYYPEGGGRDEDSHYNRIKKERFFGDDHSGIERIHRDPYPEHYLQTGLAGNYKDERTASKEELVKSIKKLVSDLTDYYNSLSKYLKKSYTENTDITMDEIQKIMKLNNFSANGINKNDYYNCNVHDIQDICSVINDIDKKVVSKQKGLLGKTFVNLEKICNDYLLELKNSIHNHLSENKDEYYINEPYYGYTIHLKNDEQ